MASAGNEVKVRRVSLIEIQFLRGSGTTEDHYRTVTGYFDDDGVCVAEKDPCCPSPYFAPWEHGAPKSVE